MPSLATRTPAPTVISDDVDLPPKVPPLPDDLYVRFPSLRQWQEDEDAWWARTYQAVQGSNRWVSQTVTQVNQSTGDLRVSFGEFSAAITTEVEAIATEQEAQARRIVTVSAMAGVSQNIKVQGTPPGGPVLNDIWINNADLSLPITYKWNGVAWAEVTTLITAAAVSDERTARVTADGFLAGKYTLTVIAGNVVTGMNITSSTGGGSDISSVIFRATDFKIYNGVTGITMFEVSGSTVNLAGTLTVSTSGKVFIGTGTYGNANTAWYVDSAGKFSLKDKLTWDGTTLAITGAITATTGSIGGFDIGSDYIRDSLNSMGLASTVTGGDDVRFWAGNTFANRATAPFRVTEAGMISAISGAIAGFTLASNSIHAGSVDSYVEFVSDVAGKGYAIQMGETGSFHYCTTQTRQRYQTTYGTDAVVKVYADDQPSATDNAGYIALFRNNVSKIALRAYDGTISVSAGFIANGLTGVSVTFNPATITSMTFTGGILTAYS